METKTLWTLPPQPLPAGELIRAVFMTIWLFACLLFALLIHLLLKAKKPTWPEFRAIRDWTLVLAL
jgi:hypothetical protein